MAPYFHILVKIEAVGHTILFFFFFSSHNQFGVAYAVHLAKFGAPRTV